MMRKIHICFLLIFALCVLASCDFGRSDYTFTVDRDPFTVNSDLLEDLCLKHSFDEWKTILQPTTISEGMKTRTCINCKMIETEKIPRIVISYETEENGNKFFVVEIPPAAEKSNPIKVVIDETERTIVVEGDSLPPNANINDVIADIGQTLAEDKATVGELSDYDFDIKIPGFEGNEDLVPSPW